MRILVTGGSGLIGRALCAALHARGDVLTVLTRQPAAARRVLPAAVGLVDRLEAIADGDRFDAFIHLAGESIAGARWTPARQRALIDSRVGVSEALLALSRRLAEPPRVVMSASAVGYYGIGADTDRTTATAFTEASPPHDDGSFSHRLCRQCEAAAAAFSNSRVIQLRLGVVLAANGGMLARLLLPFRLGLGGRVGNGGQWLSFIHRDDAVAAILFLLATDTADGAWNLTAPTPVTQRDFARSLGQQLQRPALMPMPAAVVRLLFGAMGEELLLGGQRVLPQRLQQAGFRHAFADIRSSLADLLT